jgi:hypothetical protein
VPFGWFHRCLIITYNRDYLRTKTHFLQNQSIHALCDELEAKLTQSMNDKGKLMETSMRQVLAVRRLILSERCEFTPPALLTKAPVAKREKLGLRSPTCQEEEMQSLSVTCSAT